MSKVMGGCVFRNDGDGCLSSKYVNLASEPFVETCKLIHSTRSKDETDPFVGRYQTTWLEDFSGSSITTELIISRDPNGRYLLEWTQPPYRGVGMVYHDLLVCGYWL